jgi:CheY-like chemotaxis protein
MTEITFNMNVAATILLAEDREDDIVLIQRAFEKGGIRNPLIVVRDGEEAINYLTGVVPFSDRERFPIPALLLLDLKMPRMDGFEVLGWLKTQPGLAALRVVVLTSSEDIGDVTKAYQLGANSFLVKPLDFHNTVAMVETITDYWLGIKIASPGSPATPPLENLQLTEPGSEVA